MTGRDSGRINIQVTSAQLAGSQAWCEAGILSKPDGLVFGSDDAVSKYCSISLKSVMVWGKLLLEAQLA